MKTEINKLKHLETNITKLQQLYSMHLHTAKKVDKLLSKHLPRGYAKKVADSLEKEGKQITASTVRQVKTLFLSDLQTLNTLIELAIKTKADAEAQKKKLKELTS